MMSLDFDESERDAQQERERLKREQELDDIRVLLRCEAGRRFFRRMLVDGCVFRSTYSTDHSESSFNEGHRNFALRFFNDVVEVAPEHVPSMMTGREDIAK